MLALHQRMTNVRHGTSNTRALSDESWRAAAFGHPLPHQPCALFAEALRPTDLEACAKHVPLVRFAPKQ